MRRRVSLSLLGVVLVAVALSGWAGWRVLQVRDDLSAAQTLASEVQAELKGGDVARAEASLPVLRVRFDSAARRTGGAVWAVAGHVPFVGGSFQAVRRTALAAQLLGDKALPEATAALDLARRGKLLRSGRVDLAVLAELQGHVNRAAVATARARTLVAPRNQKLLGSVRAKVDEARLRVGQLDDALQSAQKALFLAPTMLGRDGPRHYYVAVQNNAEARATGGLVGAFALVTADRGTIHLDRTGTDRQLRIAAAPVPSDPAAARTWTAMGSTIAWFDANLTPHFPDAARNLAGQWTAQSGERLDGVIALDPLVMSELLKVTGPVRLPDGTAVTSASVVDFVGHDEYVRYTDVPQRKLLLSALAADLFHQVIAAKDAIGTMQAFTRAGTSGHFFLWSAHPEEQAVLSQGLVGGALPVHDSPYLSVLTQNFGGNKLDFYLRRTVVVTPQRDGFLRLTVTLRNIAPLGLPTYMTVRSDKPTPPVPYGQAKVGFSFYGALSTEVGDARVDGRPAPMDFDQDHGHRLGTITVEIPRGTERVVTILLTEPAGELLYRQQPLVAPDVLSIQVPHRVVGR